MYRIPVGIAAIVAIVTLIPALNGQPPAPPGAAAEPFPVVRLSASPNPASGRLLKNQLYPDTLDLTPGNAATVWMRAGRAAASTKPKMTEKESKWLSDTDTPLGAFPKSEVREFLSKYKRALQLADEAARKDHCDWELPPFTIQNMNTYPLDDVQSCREIAALLSLQCRLQLSEKDFDAALRTLQTGFALARHTAVADTLIQSLVGLAVAGIMLGRVEEFIQQPNSPNLYWALTTLPSPLVDLRPPMSAELNTIYRSFPQLRKLDTVEETPAELVKFYAEMFREMRGVPDNATDDVEAKLAVTGIVLKTYPEAKRWLIAQGRDKDKVAALPSLLVVLLYQLDQYDAMRDEILAAVSLPPWQSNAALRKVDEKLRAQRSEGQVNPFIIVLLPAVSKVSEADLRMQRNVAVLRVAESLRWYAAVHDGAVPETLADVRELPAVTDPKTGKGFDALYQVNDATGILEVPPPQRYPAFLGRRFEIRAIPR